METAYPTQTPAGQATAGEQVGRYARKARGARIAIVICAVLFLVGVACAIQLQGTPMPATGNGGDFLDPAAGDRWNSLWIGTVIGLVAGFIGLPWAFHSAVIVGDREMLVYKEGFTLQWSRGRLARSWTDVVSCTFPTAHYYGGDLSPSPHAPVKLVLADGQRLTFDGSYRGPAGHLPQVLPGFAYRPVLESVVPQLLSGQAVSFGPVVVGHEGLSIERRAVRWSLVSSAWVHLSYLIVSAWTPGRSGMAARQVARLPLDRVPNLLVLLAIVQAVSKIGPDVGNLGWKGALQSLLDHEGPPQLYDAGPSSSARSRGSTHTGYGRTPRPGVRLAVTLSLALFGIALLGGGVALWAGGLKAQQDVAQYNRASACAPGQTAGCRLHEQVTVVDWNIYRAARGGTTRTVEIRLPDGSTQYLSVQQGDLFPRLLIGDQLNAELWNGTFIRLDDGEGHELEPTESPFVASGDYPVTGSFLLIVGGFLTFVTVRALLPRHRAIR